MSAVRVGARPAGASALGSAVAVPIPGARVRSLRRRGRGLILGKPLVGVLGEAGRGVELAVGTDATRQVGDLARLDQLTTDLGHQLAADGQLFGHAAVRPVVMQLQLDLDRPASLGAGQRQAVEQVDAGDEIEGVGERSLDDFRPDRPLAEHDRRGMAMKAIGDQQAAFDVVNRDGRQTIPGVGVALDREIVEAIAEVEIRVEDEIVQRDFANLHGVDSFVVNFQRERAGTVRFPIRLCRPMIGSGSRRLSSTFRDQRASERELAIMRIVVTGASGQLGSYLIDRLIEGPHEIDAWSGGTTRLAAESGFGRSS